MVDSEFDSCLKDTRLNSAEASHCVTTVGKLITPTVPRGVELRGRLLPVTLPNANRFSKFFQSETHY